MDTIILDLNCRRDFNQMELNAYRSLGSVKDLRHLIQQDIRRRRRLKIAKKIFSEAIFWSCCAFLLWAFISWVDIATTTPGMNPVYCSWNLFTMLF